MLFMLQVVIVLATIVATGFAAIRIDKEKEELSFNVRNLFVGLVFVVAAIIGVGSFGTIGAGERGVVLRFGATTNRVVAPGLYVVTPIVESVHPMDVRVQVEKSAAAAASKDLQSVATEIALNFSLDPSKVASIYRELGDDYQKRIIDPAIQEAVKATTAKYNAEQLVSQRHAVKADLTEALRTRLSNHGIMVQPDGVSVTDFKFDQAFEQAIEAKVTATQQAMKAENDLRKVQAEANQRIAQAQAEAEAIRIQAQAIQSQGGKEYVELKRIEKWDGKLPVNLYGSAPIPFINAN